MAASGTTLSHRLEGELDIVSLPGKQDNTVSADCFIGGEQDNTVWADCFIAGEQDNTVSADKTAQGRAMLHYGRRTGVSGGGSDNTVSFAASGIAFFHCRRPGQHRFIGGEQDITVSLVGSRTAQFHEERGGGRANSLSASRTGLLFFNWIGAGQLGFTNWEQDNTVSLLGSRTTRFSRSVGGGVG